MDSLHVLVEPVPVAATVLVSVKILGLVVPSSTETLALHVKLVRLVVLTVIVIVRFMVPPNTVAAGSKASASVGAGRAWNAPVRGSRYPRIPVVAWLFAVWPQAAGTAIPRQQMHNNSFVILIVVSSGMESGVLAGPSKGEKARDGTSGTVANGSQCRKSRPPHFAERMYPRRRVVNG